MPRTRPSKYEPLRAYLASRPPSVAEVTLSTAELGAILGRPLPPSAKHRSWWAPAGTQSRPQVQAWLRAGWWMRAVKPGVSVTFARGVRPAERDKYEPLRAYLASRPPGTEQVALTFGELERLLDAPLPRGARASSRWPSRWWGNGPSARLQGRAWWAAGWVVARVSKDGPEPSVLFVRRPPD